MSPNYVFLLLRFCGHEESEERTRDPYVDSMLRVP